MEQITKTPPTVTDHRAIDEVANFWKCILTALRADELEVEVDYKVDERNKVLWLYEPCAYAVYVIHHRELFGSTGMSRMNLRAQLAASGALSKPNMAVRMKDQVKYMMGFEVAKLPEDVVAAARKGMKAVKPA